MVLNKINIFLGIIYFILLLLTITNIVDTNTFNKLTLSFIGLFCVIDGIHYKTKKSSLFLIILGILFVLLSLKMF